MDFSFCTLFHSASPFPLQDGTEGQLSAEEEEARRIAEMGKPILGEHSRLEVVIEESYEFKVLCTISFILFLCLCISGFVFLAPRVQQVAYSPKTRSNRILND